MQVVLARNLLQVNDDQAQQNREAFDSCGVKVVNIISSPGAGKTTLLERTLVALKDTLAVGVIEGDIFTARDAERIADLEVPVVQINTEGICHLDARMVGGAMQELPWQQLDLVLIENVGNLICPTAFDLGEHAKVAVLSVTEGSDKPAKYPAVFKAAEVAVISKADLLPYTDFALSACKNELLSINNQLKIIVTSAITGEGFSEWLAWLRQLTGKDI